VILSSRYVNLEDGTGLVHCAPGHGKEDYEVGKEYGLDMPSPVALNGLLTEEAGKYSGKKARVVDEEIINDLEEMKALVYKMKYTHDYPLCWRCKSSLLMVAQPQWFLKISDIHSKLLKENEDINWIPSWMKLRMKAWLEGISDWPVSRMRYWGTPLPIWVCNKCDNKIVIGSADELKKIAKIPKTKKIGLHKPEIDSVKFKCECGGEMKRVPEVLDVWFDSGVSSWAALDKKEFDKFWPADLNLEGKDQVRGWWNSQLILSEIKWDKKPMVSILEHGMILDIGKKKMSKSLGNIISPQDVIQKYSRDYLRYYFAKTSKGEDFSFDEKDFGDIEKFFRVLLNINNFVNQLEQKKSKMQIEDKWILSRFYSTVEEVTNNYNSYKFPEVVQQLEKFLVNDLSKTYIQIIRDRSDEVYDVLNEIRLGFLKLLAPIVPFLSEMIWQKLKENKLVKEESIHLSDWPKTDKKKVNVELEKEFESVLKIIELGLRERDVVHIGLKWPLSNANVSMKDKLSEEIKEIIARQLNVKNIEIKLIKEGELKVELDTKMTPELEAEGYARELARFIQNERKKAGLVKEDKIEIEVSSEINNIFEQQKAFLKERVNAKTIYFSDTGKVFSYSLEGKIKEKLFRIKFSKIK
jgi:isoleucyl-tRNA synthetase